MRRRRRSHCCHYCCCCCSSCCCHCSRRSRSHCPPLRTRPSSCPWPWTELGAGCRRLGRRPTSVKWWCGVICECQGSVEVEGEEGKEGEGEHHLLPQGEQKRQSGRQNYASLQSIWTCIGGGLVCLSLCKTSPPFLLSIIIITTSVPLPTYSFASPASVGSPRQPRRAEACTMVWVDLCQKRECVAGQRGQETEAHGRSSKSW